MVQHPIVRDDARVELAHEALPDVVHAVLVVPLVQLRHALRLVRRLGEVGHVVVLPNIVQAVQLVGTDCGCDVFVVAGAGFGRELCGPVRVVDFGHVFFADADHADCLFSE